MKSQPHSHPNPTPNPILGILKDLYAIDPELKKHEKDLIPVIELLLRHNPGREPDTHFVEELRRQLREKAATLSAPPSSPFSFFTMSHISYVLAGAVAAVVITVPTVHYLSTGGPAGPAATETGTPLFSYSVSEAGDRAFGDLSKAASGGAGGREQGGGGGVGMPEMAMDAAVPPGAESDKMMIAPEWVQYDYVLSGDIPALTQDTVSVYKRDKTAARIPLSSLAANFNLGLMELNSFDDAQVEMVNFYQDKPFGYSIGVNMRDASVSVSQNWEQWPHPEDQCRDEACYRRLQLKIDQVPGDAAIIAIADAFVREHDIDVSKYGKPEVDKTWKMEYDRMADKSMAYVPEVQRVIYPLLIDGEPVLEEWGPKAGISVGVSVREKRVADAWGLMSQNLIKSSYAAVKDPAMVRSFLDQIDQVPPEFRPPSATTRTVKVTLGAPTVSYTKLYVWNEGDRQGQELMVPSLVFPVVKAEGEPYYYRQSIIVPLAEEILRSRSQPGDVRVMQEATPATDDAVKTSAPGGSGASSEDPADTAEKKLPPAEDTETGDTGTAPQPLPVPSTR